MPMFTAPALLIGLGARILLNKFSRGIDAEPSLPESILLGVWQGVAAQYASKHGILAILPGTAIPAKLFYDWHTSTDPNQRFLTTIIGLLLGVVSAELLSSYLDVPPEAHDPDDEDASEVSSLPRKRTRSLPSRYLPPVPQHHTPKPAGERTVKFRPSVQGGDTESSVRPALTLVSDIPSLSVGSTFDMLLDAPAAASPVEREIAALRARASLADSERRRYKEERKWALSQGDDARAEQMKSEYKRYKTLMESCHREADQRLLAMEAEKERAERERDSRKQDRYYDHPRREPPPASRSSRIPPSHRSTRQPSPSSSHEYNLAAPSHIRHHMANTNGAPNLTQPSPSYREFKAAQQQRRASSAAARAQRESSQRY